MKQSFCILFSLCLVASAGFAQSARLDSLWNDPATEQRIESGIEANRKGDFTLQFPAYRGKTEIEIHQLKNEFFFGANAFMIKGFDSGEKNEHFEKLFASLFNLAVVPFFWKTLEPEPGKLRFDSTSSYIYRRPPPDVTLAFCKKYDITPKGHCLVWNNPTHSMPEWLPKDTAAVEQLIAKRIRTIAGRYGSSIKMWDVVNEALHYFPGVIMPNDYVQKSFEVATKSFPAGDQLMINETTALWQNNNREYSPYYMLIRNLKERGISVGAIGLQFHFFSEELFRDVLAGKAMTPAQLFSTLDLYAEFERPLQISEITIPTLPDNDIGRQQQAKLTRNFYRLWFSHPAVQAIIWWNSVDGTAVKGEDKWNGGFVNNDFSPKPAYDVLNTLINKDWKTNSSTSVQNGGSYAFRGFYGEYEIRIKQGKNVIERKVIFHRNGESVATLNK